MSIDSGLIYQDEVIIEGDKIKYKGLKLRACQCLKNPYRLDCEIIDQSEKGILIQVDKSYTISNRFWLPKSQCGWEEISGGWPFLVVEKWLVAQKNLYQ